MEKNSKQKKGFIMLYSLALMTFVLVLIGLLMSLAQSEVDLQKSSIEEFGHRQELDQLGEYFASGNYQMLDSSDYYVVNWYINDESNRNYSLVVSREERVVLYVQTIQGRVVCWIYGEKSSG